MSDSIDYRQHMQNALQNVMASVLSDVAVNGLPGEHHFLIAVDTTHPGVDIPEFLKQQYPQEIRLLLQHWFEDLTVAADRFSVTLNFSNAPQQLVVPFDAVLSFVDPSVEFGLRFEQEQSGPAIAEVADMPQDEAQEPEDAPEAPAAAPQKSEGEVVSLDQFRKK